MDEAQQDEVAEGDAHDGQALDDDVKADDRDHNHRKHREHHAVLDVEKAAQRDAADKEPVAGKIDCGGHAYRHDGGLVQLDARPARDVHAQQLKGSAHDVLQRVSGRGAEERGPGPHVVDKDDRSHKDGEQRREHHEGLEGSESGDEARHQWDDCQGEQCGEHETLPSCGVRPARESQAEQDQRDQQLHERLQRPPPLEKRAHL